MHPLPMHVKVLRCRSHHLDMPSRFAFHAILIIQDSTMPSPAQPTIHFPIPQQIHARKEQEEESPAATNTIWRTLYNNYQ